MKAITQRQYGSPDVLRLDDIEIPAPADNEVLVRVYGSSIHAGDWHLMRGTPWLIRLIFGGLFRPKFKVPGTDIAGQVEAVGSNVTQFNPGDEVFGDLSSCGFGAFAEYAVAPETLLVPKPANLTFEAAATVPTSAVAALQALRDEGALQAGQRVLISGASGGVGSFAIQIAKVLGAEVTAVCSTAKVGLVRALGADHVVDYTQQDPTQTAEQYDLIVDAAAYRPAMNYQAILKLTGTYVLVGGSSQQFLQTMLLRSWLEKRMQRSIKTLESKPNQVDLLLLKDWIEAGKIVPAVERSYPLEDVPQAIRHLEARQVQGKVAIAV
ncbi:MAG: NAD(P)-dependent alcohol dehydrogenase [Cyanobacteria bacterium P01_C01_bin.120]